MSYKFSKLLTFQCADFLGKYSNEMFAWWLVCWVIVKENVCQVASLLGNIRMRCLPGGWPVG